MSRIQRFRKKLSLPGNEKVLQIHKEKEKQNKKKYLESIKSNQKLLEDHRQRNAEASRRYYEKKKEKLCFSNKENDSFSSSSALSKAVNKVVKALPNNESKAQEVVKKVSNMLNISSSNEIPIPVKKPRLSFIETPDIVHKFFHLDNISRQLPGKNDYVNLKTNHGKKEKVQKRTMLMTVEEAYREYKLRFPDNPVSISKFHSLRPLQVVKFSETPHNICVCIYCANMEFIVESLDKYFIPGVDNLKDVETKLSCYRDSFDCSSGKCSECFDYASSFKKLLLPEIEDKMVELKRWEKHDGFIQKRNKCSTAKDSIELFIASYKSFKIHRYLIKSQQSFMATLKETQAGTEALIIVDFSQNYTAKQQDEAQSAYYCQRQISVFTAVAYIGQRDHVSYVIVNDNITHSKEQVHLYLQKIIKDLRNKNDQLEHVSVFSDGCCSQFKNKFTLSNLLHSKTDFGVTIDWHFFPTSHGKSPADGIGGTVKRGVHNRVLSGKACVINAEEFYNCARTFTTKIELMLATNEETEEVRRKMQERWDKVKTIKGTRDFHYFKPIYESGKIQASVSSREEGVKMFEVIS